MAYAFTARQALGACCSACARGASTCGDAAPAVSSMPAGFAPSQSQAQLDTARAGSSSSKLLLVAGAAALFLFLRKKRKR